MPSTETAPEQLWYLRPYSTDLDTHWMHRAVELAKAALPDDMPFGCVIVGPDGQALCETWGTGNHDPLAHSEMMAIHLIADQFKEPEWLSGCTLYSTAEPCGMCCGGINHAKLSRVVFGSWRDDLPHLFSCKRRSALATLADTTHPPVVIHSVLRAECIRLFDGVAKWD